MKGIVIAYIQVVGTLLLTIYGQLIIKSRLILYGQLPDGIYSKFRFLIKVLFDPFVFSGFISAFIASLLWMSAMTKLPISRAYPIMSLAPMLVLIFGIIFFGEEFTFGKLAGCIIIIIGVIISVKY